MADKDPRQLDREAELARQAEVEIAVANRNLQISRGLDPDPNVGSGFYGGEAAPPIPEAEKPLARKRGRPRKE